MASSLRFLFIPIRAIMDKIGVHGWVERFHIWLFIAFLQPGKCCLDIRQRGIILPTVCVCAESGLAGFDQRKETQMNG